MGKGKHRRAKPKKEKITYIDDGSTVSDMSGLGRKPVRSARPAEGGRSRPEPTTRAGNIWRTYWDAVRAMIGPMLVVIGGISVIFLLIWIILGFFA